MITFEYTKFGRAVSDFEYQIIMSEILDNKEENKIYQFSNEIMFLYALVLIYEGTIEHTEIVFEVNRYRYHPNDKGRVKGLFKEQINTIDNLMTRLLEF